MAEPIQAVSPEPEPIVPSTPEPVEPAPQPLSYNAVPEEAPAADAPVLGFSKHLETDPAPAGGLDDDDGWSTSHYQAFDEPVQASVPTTEAQPVQPVADPAPMTFDAPVADAAPMAFDTPVADESSLYGLDAPFADPVPESATDSSAVAGEVMNDLAYLNSDLDSQLPEENWQMDSAIPDVGAPAMPEPIQPSAPAQASPVPEPQAQMPAPVPTLGDADPFGSLSDLVVDEEPEEDRGSVLKFLRRD